MIITILLRAVAFVIPARVSGACEESRKQFLSGVKKIGILRAAATRENDKSTARETKTATMIYRNQYC
jgi:hypothetical protein